jgi:hypothetical protein
LLEKPGEFGGDGIGRHLIGGGHLCYIGGVRGLKRLKFVVDRLFNPTRFYRAKVEEKCYQDRDFYNSWINTYYLSSSSSGDNPRSSNIFRYRTFSF